MRYNWANLVGRTRFPHWRGERPGIPFQDYVRWTWRSATNPAVRLAALSGQRRVSGARGPLYVFPLQREGDAQIRFWSPYRSMADATQAVIASFARCADPNARLIVTSPAFDNGLLPWRRIVRRTANRLGVASRVHHLSHLAQAPILTASRGVVTVNGTAGLRALCEGKPVAALGTAVYDMPGLTWQGELDRFWSEATPPDMELVDALRRVLAAHCLIRGGFFDEDEIRVAVDSAVERMTLRSGVSIPAQLAQG